MARNLITSLLALATNLLSSITAFAQAPSSSSSNSNNSEMGCARAVEEDLKRLMVTLKGIKATLLDAEEREIRDHYVKHWLKELKKVAYDAEDVLSDYRYEVTRLQVEARKASEACSSQKGKQMESIEHTVPIADDMLNQIHKIRSRFDEIAKDREALQLRESDGVRRLKIKKIRPPTSHMVDEANIFGRGDEISEVINFILSGKEKPFLVISIIGKGGLGKTTIAQLVYKELRDSQCFKLFAWVCVSEEFDVGRLTKAIIEALSKINYGLSELSSLQEKLAEIVKGQTILLVLDDVWNENQILWELFRIPFKEAKMVRILVTTRNKKVAEIMQTTANFSPTNLPEDYCWQLFQHYAFSGTSDNVPTHLINMGWDIMRKCGGLPLAVKSIASLLRHESYEERWREILESDLWESNPSNDIFPALQISYVHLPPYLKPCFLFCSMYPKDYILTKMKLIEIWISHGYIEPRGKRKIREIGVQYYEELKQRSFLDDFSDDSQYESCKLHDIIHDLARLNSENEYYSVGINWPCDIQVKTIPREACHLYARGSMGYVNQIVQQNLKGLRTLSMDLRNCSGYLGHQYNRVSNLPKFEALRVLELAGDFNEVPDSIGLLYNLQTLILNCFYLEYLPESIGDLANLQFLNIQSNFIKKLPKSLCSLSNLLRLVIICVNLKEVPLDLRDLHNLHELTIISQQPLAFPNTIGCLSSLEKLNISCGGDTVKDLIGYVPHDLVSFPAIKKIAAGLIVRNIAWLKDMNTLEGRLSIEGLDKMSNLVDAQHANLRNKCKLEALDLCWDHDPDYRYSPFWDSDQRLRLRLEAHEGKLVGALPNTILSKQTPALRNMKVYLSNIVSPDDVPRGLSKSTAKTMAERLRSRTRAWLKDNKDLEGKLSMEGVDEMSNLVDAQHANLRYNCKLETLNLCWDSNLETYEGGIVGAIDVDFALLECFQPHPNLKKLRVKMYPSATVPGWMRDPLCLQSIQIVVLERCDKIQSLPFRNLHTLRHLCIHECYSIRVLKLDQLPFQLKELQISDCGCLEFITGLGNMDMFADLEIYSCNSLESITMDELQLLESTEPFGDSSCEVPHISRQSNSSLPKFIVKNCYSLFVLPISNFHTLRHLKINSCCSIRVLQLEQLSSQLEKLQIDRCEKLESITGLGNLNMLTVLEIYDCSSLKSLLMDEQKLVEKPDIGRQNMSALKCLVITFCIRLCALPDGLIPSGPCYVCVHHCGCPDLQIGHLQ